jgi:hypothetical protein
MLRFRYLLIVLLMLCPGVVVFAQKSKRNGAVKGTLVNASTKVPFNDLTVAIPSVKAFTISDAEGKFVIAGLPYGTYEVVISGEYAVSKTIQVNVKDEATDAGTIEVAPSPTKNEVDNQIPTIAIDDNEGISEDDINAGQNMLGYFTPAQDQFLFNVNRTFGSFWYSPRGFRTAQNLFNGYDIADLGSGFSTFSLFGGLNDVLRSRSITYGTKASDFSYGVPNGTVNYIDATAASQRKGTTVSYAAANRAWRNRIMVTHNSGILKNGWSYSLSFSKRWAQEGYYDGTYYDAYSYYAAASKALKKGTISLTTIGAPTSRGLVSTAVDEAFDLAGSHYYNPYWGYQQGKKRSGRTSNSFQPITVLNYTHTPSDRTKWNTSLGYQFGTYKRGSIDFYNGYNPAPDYYRNLPGYYINGVTNPNASVAADVTAQLRANPSLLQIQWDNMYQDNYLNNQTIQNANGSGQAIAGKQSIFVFSNQVDKMSKVSFNSTIDHSINERFNVQGGINVTRQSDEFYKQLEDLMGGDFFVNYNQFAAQANQGNPSATQNNLNVPNQIVKVGDKYNYDYILNILRGQAWAQGVYNFRKFNFFAAANVGYTTFNRDGLTKNGIFPNESYGKSASQNFTTYGVKGGVRFQPDAHNILFLNGSMSTEAPGVHNTFISERTRNGVVTGPEVASISAAEGGYQYKSTKLVATVSGYITDMKDGTTIMRFFNDDPEFQSYVNYVMQNVGIRSIGTELSLSYKINESFVANLNAAVGQTYYTNRPTVSIYVDNDPTATQTARQVYIQNYYVARGPQSVYTAGLTYRRDNNTRFGINVNYMDRNYVGINPERRTTLAVDMITNGSTQWSNVVDQEKLPAAMTVDVNGSKTWNISKWTQKTLHRGSSLVLNAGINNLLNNQDIKLIGYEQLRYDYKNKNAMKFPTKYTYAMGINFLASLSWRF